MSKQKRPAAEPVRKKRNVVFISLSSADEAALTAFIATHRIAPDRSAVGYTALVEFLKREGFDPKGYATADD